VTSMAAGLPRRLRIVCNLRWRRQAAATRLISGVWRVMILAQLSRTVSSIQRKRSLQEHSRNAELRSAPA